ncbi:MAG: cyclopropane-fatty-acyl-phospholipid synthase, partial [Solirubrobacteraceae bacterium]|nr:cyclopropane-fatty-acyl-phospholipid synthase [Solirubrobacteraceae bacterium]
MSTAPLRHEIERLLPDRPFAIEWWDGASTPATRPSEARFRVRSRRALGHALRAPGQLGLGRAYVSGELELADLDAVIDLLATWAPPPLGGADRRRLMLAALRAHGPALPPAPPAVELRPRGRRHSIARDKRAVTHHYDVSNDFFALFLDASMTYSCAVFARDDEPLEDAQERKLELVCSKLA